MGVFFVLLQLFKQGEGGAPNVPKILALWKLG